MRVIECPGVVTPEASELSLFLAGGITNCPDWQKEMIQRFKDVDGLIIYNPRRVNFDINNPADSEFQIRWEYAHLNRADAILFWFPYHTACPITLYELGVHAAKGSNIFVGCHPGYHRKFDVEHQLGLIRPDVQVHDNFKDLVDDIIGWMGMSNG